MRPDIETLFNYLRDVIYEPENAALNVEKLPEDIQEFGKGLQYFVDCVIEINTLATALSKGDLGSKLPSRDNEMASPLKSLHASLKHLSWQAQQIAAGDYSQRVAFMGDFSDAFNKMVEQLDEREQNLKEYAFHDSLTQLYNRNFGMFTLDIWLQEKRQFALIFVDLDSLKHVNDEFGHNEGDIYIKNAAKHLNAFSHDTMVCRIGGDEFMMLAPDINEEKANIVIEYINQNFINEPYLHDKPFEYSFSFGIVEVDRDNSLPASDILSIADERMYQNKRTKKIAKRKLV